ncbi:MAG: rod shape-determining protein MreD [Pseudomonadota bacterium]
MARSALSSKQGAFKGGAVSAASYIPAATVVAASALSLLPIVSVTGWWPNAGFLMLIAWRLLRIDPWPAWWAAPLGFINDLLTGAPIGLSVTLWSAVMLAMEFVDSRTQWRDYWVEWAIATILITADCWFDWQIAGLMGAPVPFLHIVPAIVLSMFAFPIAAMIVARLDRWRFGR